MKKRNKVEEIFHRDLYRTFNRTNHFISDEKAWADLLLSKTALIIATMIILTAVYALAASSSDVVKKDELEVITVDLVSNIDSLGSVHSIAGNDAIIYTFDSYTEQLIDHNKLNISVTGEYVTAGFEEDRQTIRAARMLSYRTLPFSPDELRDLLIKKFGANGNISQPVNSVFPYTDVTDLLSIEAAEELYLNTSKDVIIEQASIFVADGSEVNELEYVLVYQ